MSILQVLSINMLHYLLGVVVVSVHVAEFIIMLGERNPTFDKFQAALAENGAEFPVSKILCAFN